MTSVSILKATAARIQRLLDEQSEPKPSWTKDAGELLKDLKNVSEKLEEYRKKQIEPGSQFLELEGQIVQLAYEIDAAVALAAARARRSPSNPNQIGKLTSMLQGSGMLPGTQEKGNKADLQSLKTQLSTKTGQLDTIKGEQQDPSVNTMLHQPDEEVPATPSTEDKPSIENKVRSAVLGENENIWVVYIWGKSGMGKSMLAKKKIYRDPDVRKKFAQFAWVTVSRDFQTKHILQSILLQLLPHKKAHIRKMDEIELAQQIFSVLKNCSCLVVLDQIEDVADWRGIRMAFPIGHSNRESKIIVITPTKEVANEATKFGVDYEVEPQTEPQCFKILKEEAKFDEQDWKNMGSTIYDLSGGSPLTAIVLGKSLKRVEEAAVRTKLLSKFDFCPARKQNSDDVELPILGISYKCLPLESKPRFLCMGQFPGSQVIPVENLYLLLASEDFVPSMDSLVETLQAYSEMGLVEVHEDKMSKKKRYKSCRLHRKIRDMCISQGKDERFFEIVQFATKEKNLSVSSPRLALYLSRWNGESIQFSSPDMVVEKIHSLLIFDTPDDSQSKKTWPSEMTDLRDFCSLRILYFDGVDLNRRKLPKGIEKLFILRNLSFRGCLLEQLPSYIGTLLCLEILDLRVTKIMKIGPEDLLSNMKNLKHLYFPEQFEKTSEKKLQLHELVKLEVLVNFDTEDCDAKDLSKLKKLGHFTAVSDGNQETLDVIVSFLEEGRDNELQSSLIIRDFDCYMGDKNAILKRLLECKSLHSLRIEGWIDQLPEGIKISETIFELHLDGSELEHDPMNVFRNAEHLRSLILTNDAFIGSKMTFPAAKNMLPNLRILKLQNLSSVKELKFEKEAMPKLSTLVIDNCEDLEELLMPEELDGRLKRAQQEEGDDVYSVEPSPSLYD